VLHVRSFGLAFNAQVRVRGNRALVIFASSDVTLQGVLDASAHHDEPGPGGARPGEGRGAGSSAMLHDDVSGSGAGGAGHATRGGAGGAATGPGLAGAAGGATYGTDDVAALEAGSGGGLGGSPALSAPGGAGGGAVQIFSARAIHVLDQGAITVGGGGGGADPADPPPGPAGAGGSGGSVVLQAAVIDGRGVIAANGGGGGGGSGEGQPQSWGEDGVVGTRPARGGVSIGGLPAGSAGGAGGCGLSPAAAAGEAAWLGGGGGGAAGRIRVLTGGASPAELQFSPAASIGQP